MRTEYTGTNSLQKEIMKEGSMNEGVEKAGGTILYDPNVKVMHQKSSSDVFPGFIEWHKAKSFCTYFDKHFRNQYPKWILNIFATAIYVRFGLRLFPTTILWLFNKISSQN